MMGSGSLFPQNLPGDEGLLGCRRPGTLLFLTTTSQRPPSTPPPHRHSKGKAIFPPFYRKRLLQSAGVNWDLGNTQFMAMGPR